MGTNAQINNLNTFLSVSFYSAEQLVRNLQYKWNMDKPFELYSKDGKSVRSYMVFIYKGGRKQTLNRITTMDLSTSLRQYSTELVTNEKTLLSSLRADLKKDFILVAKTAVNEAYTDPDGFCMIKLQTVSHPKRKLKSGFYSIQIIIYSE